MRFALLALLAGGCAYEAGTYRSTFADFAGQRATIDCLDIAVGRAADSVARGALVRISFGNRCDHRVTVDLVSMRAVAHGATLAPYDPRGELEVATLPGGIAGSETFSYPDAAPTEPICVDIGGIARDAVRTTRWVCL